MPVLTQNEYAAEMIKDAFRELMKTGETQSRVSDRKISVQAFRQDQLVLIVVLIGEEDNAC